MSSEPNSNAGANIARRLTMAAQSWPHARAVIAPAGRDRAGRRVYAQLTFEQLEQETNAIAQGLLDRGLKPGTRLALFVPFSIEFISLTFALFKAGATVVLVDPGMGKANILDCLADVQPEGFIAIPKVHLVRWLYRKQFPSARWNVSVGRRLPGILATYEQLRRTPADDFEPVATQAADQAAIIFTSGSTGPPKGVVYEHGMFDAQVDLIRNHYGIQPGEIDLPGFPLFGLFNAAMGVTTVIPDMDPTRPAQVDPQKIITAVRDQGVTQAFGSPAFWNRVGRYCCEKGITLPTIRRALSAGGPVPNHVLERMLTVLTHPEADLFTPYGATESLPVTSIGAREVLSTTAARTRQGAGTCVGRPFAGVDVRIIPVTDGPIASLTAVPELPPGEIGEIIVRGRSVTRAYFANPDATRAAKIPDGDSFWHRIGDVGYRDEEGKLWFCGRKAHIVRTSQGPLYSVCCEAIFDEHPQIYRTALVGIGTAPAQTPVIVAEPEPGCFPDTPQQAERLKRELLELGAAHPMTQFIREIRFHRSLPVDTRHNVKINREALALWTAGSHVSQKLSSNCLK